MTDVKDDRVYLGHIREAIQTFVFSAPSELRITVCLNVAATAVMIRRALVCAKMLPRVTLAIAPDWSPTGSSGMLSELAYAERLRVSGALKDILTEQALVEMATVNAAKLAGLDNAVGKLAPGYAADLIVLRRRPADPTTEGTPAAGHDDRAQAYQALVKQSPNDLLLVVIGGTPVYGEPALMKRLLSSQPLESVAVCGETVWSTLEGRYISEYAVG